MYYYVYNLQGDVTHILNASGGIVDTYEYDEWGKILNLGSLTAIAQANPFRYRGYYYDTESGLYYLNSRYYNAEWGRFINADGIISSNSENISGFNLFVYCGNNPINRIDSSGYIFNSIIKFMGKINGFFEPIFTASSVCDSVVSGTDAALQSISKSLAISIMKAEKPNNIGYGTYNNLRFEDLQMLSKLSKTSSKISKFLSYGVIIIDVGSGLIDNIKANASIEKMISDGLVDAAFSGGSLWISGYIGGKAGAFVGSAFPVAGTIVGFCVGFVAGMGISYVTDVIKINGHTVKDWVKMGVSN